MVNQPEQPGTDNNNAAPLKGALKAAATGPANTSSPSSAVQTGDSSHTVFFAVIVMLSLGCIVLLVGKKRKSL